MANRDIRPATLADKALLRAWVNAEDSWKWKKDTKNLISADEHLAWLHSRLADPFTQIWIAVHDGTPSGQVRLEKKVILFTWTFMLFPVCGEQALLVSRSMSRLIVIGNCLEAKNFAPLWTPKMKCQKSCF